MIKHYNAFISYKHADLDNKVAATIQRSLEHYKIPRKLQKKTGKKRIERVFRDKDELPITSNLSDDISYALEHADYLIVICSTNTRKSIWVEREIQFFLQNHSMNQILTVLADGEPQDVIPEILLSEEKTITDEDGNEQVVRLPLEPLSCDWRLPERKAKREELPRLAATLIGCSYDELMNRQRQYKMQRLTAVFAMVMALALGFGAYMVYSNMQIHKNYLQALYNQSKYLANASRNQMEKQQRITALYLALEALPKDETDEKPVTTEAIRAISDATLAYCPQSGSDINPIWNYSMPDHVRTFHVSEDGKRLLGIDRVKNIIVWDTDTCEQITKLENVEDLDTADFIGPDAFLVMQGEVATAYDSHNGEKLWEYENDNYLKTDIIPTADDKNVLLYDSEKVLFLDVATGQVVKSCAVELPEEDDDLLMRVTLSPNAKKIAYRRGSTLEDTYALGVMDLESGERNEILLEDNMFRFCWADDEHLVASFVSPGLESSSALGTSVILASTETPIICYDGNTLQEIWNQTYVGTAVAVNTDFMRMPAVDAISYYSGNIYAMYDIATGSLLHSYDVGDAIINVSDPNGTGSPSVLTWSGRVGSPLSGWEKDAIGLQKIMTDSVIAGEVNHGLYAQQDDGNNIFCYRSGVYDKDYTAMGDGLKLQGSVLFTNYLMNDNYLVILTDEEKGATISLFDVKEGKLLQQIPLGTEEDKSYQYELMEIKEDKLYLSTKADSIEVTVDLKDYHIENRERTYEEQDALKAEEEKKLEEAAEEKEFYESLNLRGASEPLYYEYHTMPDGQKLFFVVFADGTLSRYDADTKEFIGKTDIMISGGTKYRDPIFTWDDEKHTLYLQLDTILSIVDTETWITESIVYQCLGYHAGSDRFYIYSKGGEEGNEIGYYKHYTVEDLIQKAKDILHGTEMSPEEKAMYGIE